MRVKKMLQQTATEEAMASTATSLRNSSLEGKMLCGGSFIDFSNEIDDIEEEDEEGRRWRPLRVEDMASFLSLRIVAREKGNGEGKEKGNVILKLYLVSAFWVLNYKKIK